MKLSLFVLLLICTVQCGCMAQILRRNSVIQTDTSTDLSYQQVMENLALIANDPDILPCYSVIDAGTSTVNDTYGINGIINALPKVAGNGSFDPNLKRTVSGNWVLTQVTGPEKLRALSLAFRYAICNDDSLLHIHDHCVTLDTFCYPQGTCQPSSGEALPTPAPINPVSFSQPSTPVSMPSNLSNGIVSPDAICPGMCCFSPKGTPGYYFGVSPELQAIPSGWLCVGCKKQVPRRARYTAKVCDTYVWVTDDGLDGLSRFTLAIQRIARVATEATYAPMPSTLSIVDDALLSRVPISMNCQTDLSDLKNLVKIQNVQLPIDCYGNVVISKFRGDAIQTTDSKLKSALTGVIKTQ